jgi:hypothetical protein
MNNILFKISIICGLLIAGSVGAQITSINSVSSYGTLTFNDVNSLNPSLNPGSTYSQGGGGWSGSPKSLSQTDPTTLDNASGILDASGFGGFNYPLVLNNVTLSQPNVNTGYADLLFQFTIEYQLGGGGLPGAATQFPNFLISGTVQPSSTSYASLTGSISYYGVDAAGVYGNIETVNYNWLYNTPGTFSGITVSGVPVNGSLPTQGAGSTLTLVGNLTFEVDPASINVQTVPEPGTIMLVGMGLVGLLMIGRRRK